MDTLMPRTNTPLPFVPILLGPTGSNYICTPPVEDTDVDYVVLVRSLQDAVFALVDDGWQTNLDDPAYRLGLYREIEFATARKGTTNLILYDNTEGYDAFSHATGVARRLNLLNKEDRIALFQAVLGGRARH